MYEGQVKYCCLFMQPCLQKSFALKAIFAFYFWLFELFYFLFYLYRNNKKLDPFIMHLFICVFYVVCISDLIYIYFIIESLSHIFYGGKVFHAFRAGTPHFVCISLHVGQTILLVILQLYLQKSLALQVILLFNLFLSLIFTFYLLRREKFQT